MVLCYVTRLAGPAMGCVRVGAPSPTHEPLHTSVSPASSSIFHKLAVNFKKIGSDWLFFLLCKENISDAGFRTCQAHRPYTSGRGAADVFSLLVNTLYSADACTKFVPSIKYWASYHLIHFLSACDPDRGKQLFNSVSRLTYEIFV